MNDNKEKTEGMMLEEQLVWKFPHIGKDAPEQVEAAAEFCEDYKAFLDEGKTERECVEAAVKRLQAAGYTEFEKGFEAMHSGKSGKVILDWTTKK